VPKVLKENMSAWAQYSVLHPQRDVIIKKLRENNIPTAVYYPIPLHLQEAFAHLGCRKNDFPVAEKIAGEIFSLPMHPYLEKKEQEIICQIIGREGSGKGQGVRGKRKKKEEKREDEKTAFPF